MRTLTERQAYAAMFYYLEKIWNRSKFDFLGTMLSDMSLLSDGSTADAAVEIEWKDAVDFALRGGEAGKFQIIR